MVRELLAMGAAEVLVSVRALADCSAKQRFGRLAATLNDDSRLTMLEIDASEPGIAIPSRVRGIVNCAASVDFMDEARAIESNVAATWHLMCAAARLPHLRRIVHISTLTIRTDSPADFTETDLDTGQRFVSPYTLTKFLAEVMIRKFHRGMPVTIVRTGTILPAPSDPPRAGSDWFRNTIKLWAQGRVAMIPIAADQHIYPVLVNEAARAIVGVLRADTAPDLLHIPVEPGPCARWLFDVFSKTLEVPPPQLRAHYDEEWQHYRASLAPFLRRIVDSLYPPAPPDGRLSLIDSRTSADWFRTAALSAPTIDEFYWRGLATGLADIP